MNKESTERLKLFRKERQYSQEDMAKTLGISRGSYTQIELGNSGIQDDHLPKLIEMGLSLNWLFAGKGEKELRSEPASISIGALNTGVAGSVNHTYNTVGDCEKDLAVMEERLVSANGKIDIFERELLRRDEIINQLLNK